MLGKSPVPGPGGKGREDAKAAERRRTLVLACVATFCLLLLGVRVLVVPGGSLAEPGPAPHSAPGAAQAAAAPAGTDERPLDARYKPILDADPFREHAFKRREAKREGKGGTHEEAAPVTSSSGPSAAALTLRLTGIVFQDQASYGIFEDRSTGKGLFLKRGDKVGAEAVAYVSTDALVLLRADLAATASGSSAGAGAAPVSTATTSVRLGDKLDVKLADVEARLETLGPPTSASTSGTSPASSGPLPQLSDDQRSSVLERLKKRRQASLAGGS